MKDIKRIVSIIILFLFVPFSFVGCKFAPPLIEDNISQENEYTASSVMYSTLNIVDYYSNNFVITKIEDNQEIASENCFYDIITGDFFSLVMQCYDFWEYCKSGGTSFSEMSGSITKTYNITFDEENCNVVYIYTDSSQNPFGSAYRITKIYDISFKTNHLSICYENQNDSFYQETKYYVDILIDDNGIFVQYYKKKYNGDYFKTYSYDIYKLYYNLKTENLLYSSNQIKHGSTTSTIPSIEITTFENFEMPEFLYSIKKL